MSEARNQRVDMPIADTQGLGSGAMDTRQEAPPRARNKACSWLCLTWETATLFQFVLTKHTSNFLLYSQNTLAFFSRGDMPEGFPQTTELEFVYLSSHCTKSILKQEAREVAAGSRPLQSLMNHQLPGSKFFWSCAVYWVQNFHPQLFTDQSHFSNKNTFNCARRWNFRVSVP